MHKQDREQALAKTALALMAECEVAPTPDNYELFYAYAVGDNPAISRALGDAIAARQPLADSVLADIRAQCLSAGRMEQAVNTAGADLTDALGLILRKIDAAGKDATAFGRTLSAAHGELGGVQSPAELRQLLGTLRTATAAMETRTKSLETELQKSSHEVSTLRTQLDDVRKESLTDALTNVANRKAFDIELQRAIHDAKTQGEPFSLFMCDIDHFKQFNDTWGHQIGDQVLRLVGNCLSENVKGRDTAARYGGEEFCVILRQSSLANAVKLAEQIRGNVESKKLVKKSTGDILGTLTISIGVAQYGKTDSVSTLVERADAAMYRAKGLGRNRVIGEDDPRFAGGAVDAA